jgi:hypothetical protein
MLTQKTTPRHYRIPSQYQKSYEKKIVSGLKVVHNNKVVIIGMIRDVQERIPLIIQKVESIGKLFKDYIVLIVENDSKDLTRKSLFEWRGKNPRVNILGCGVNNPKNCLIPKTPRTEGHRVDRSRIEKMAMLRNIYLDYIKANINPKEYEFSLVWDLDSISVIYEDGFLHSMGLFDADPTLGVVCAYGIYQWGFFTLYYDTYAHLEKGEKFDSDQKLAHDFRHGVWEAKAERGSPPVEVDSCFSGFTIYKTNSLIKSKYDLPKGNLVCEHVALHQRIASKKLMNPSMINLIMIND